MFEIDRKHFSLSCTVLLAKGHRRMEIAILHPTFLAQVAEAHLVEAQQVEAVGVVGA